MGPVNALFGTSRPTRQFVDRYAERFCLDVPECEVDAGDRLGCDATGALARHAIHIPVAGFEWPWILADKYGLEFFHSGDNAVRVAAIGALAVSGDAFVSAHCNVLPGTPSCVDYEGINSCDFHGKTPVCEVG